MAGPWRATAMHLRNGLQNLLRRRVFHEVAGGAGLHRLENQLRVLLEREPDDLSARQQGAEPRDT